MDILNNPWITGIGGGIISSLIVFFITQYLFRKKERREYLQKIKTANNEILYSIRPLVIDKKLPTNKVVSAIRLSTAKKYGIEQEDLYNTFSLYNDLVTEIMGNSFLSSDQKLDFFNLLKQMKSRQNTKEKVELLYILEKNSINSRYRSILIALFSFPIALISILRYTKKMETYSFDLFKENILLLSIIVVTSVSIFVIIRSRTIFTKREAFPKERKNIDQELDEILND